MRDGSSVVVPVRIGSQSRVFALSPTGKMRFLNERLLKSSIEKLSERIMSIHYYPNGIRAYHRHRIGKMWVPTAPELARGASSIEVSDLSAPEFVSNLPQIKLKNTTLRRWFPKEAIVSNYSVDGEVAEIRFSQTPEIESINSFVIRGRVARPLSFLDGNVVLEIAVADYFGFGRRIRVYHDGHSEARLGLQHSTRFNSILCVACDGVRERFLYRANRSVIQTATTYVSDPGKLYSFSRPDSGTQTRLIKNLGVHFVLKVDLLRDLEWSILDHGNHYDHGMIGAEIAYTLASEMFLTHQLLIQEPAMHGSDIVSKDGSTAVEARMLSNATPKTASYMRQEVAAHIKQMIGRLRWGLSKKAYKRGVAIICIRLNPQSLIALVKEA